MTTGVIKANIVFLEMLCMMNHLLNLTYSHTYMMHSDMVTKDFYEYLLALFNIHRTWIKILKVKISLIN